MSSPLEHLGGVQVAAFGPGGRLVTASRDGMARIWHPQAGALVATSLHHDGPVVWAAFDATSSRVVTASVDGTARIWDVSTGTAAESDTLAELAEAASAHHVDDRGTPVPLGDAPALVRRACDPSRLAGSAPGAAVRRWFCADPWARTVTPFSSVTVQDYVQRLASQGEAGRREVARWFPGYRPSAAPPARPAVGTGDGKE